jgi:hypothetical protein
VPDRINTLTKYFRRLCHEAFPSGVSTGILAAFRSTLKPFHALLDGIPRRGAHSDESDRVIRRKEIACSGGKRSGVQFGAKRRETLHYVRELGLGFKGLRFFSHGFSFQFEFARVMYEVVERGVGQGGVANGLVPVFEG